MGTKHEVTNMVMIVDGKEIPISGMCSVEITDTTPWWSKLYQKIFRRYRYQFIREFKIKRKFGTQNETGNEKKNSKTQGS